MQDAGARLSRSAARVPRHRRGLIRPHPDREIRRPPEHGASALPHRARPARRWAMPVAADVAVLKPVTTGTRKRRDAVQHVVERKAGIVRVAQVATGALAEDHATDPVYHPRQAELLQHDRPVGSSLMSSRNRIAPSKDGSQPVPINVDRIVRLPPSRRPRAVPSTRVRAGRPTACSTAAPPSTGTSAANAMRHKLSQLVFSQLLAAFGAWRVGKAQRVAIAQCMRWCRCNRSAAWDWHGSPASRAAAGFAHCPRLHAPRRARGFQGRRTWR